MAQEWEQRGIPAVALPQSDSRMIPSSERLYDAAVHKRLVLPDDDELNAHVHAAVAKSSRRGWRLDQADRSSKIDAVVALAMAVDRHAYQPEYRAARMAVARPCLDCGAVIPSGSRCSRCSGRRRGTTTEPGYGSAYQRLARAAIAQQPWCSLCGAADDLTADHVVPLAVGGDPLGPLRVLCRRCNSGRGASI